MILRKQFRSDLNEKIRYPRVLIVYHARLNKADQNGVSIRGWFGDWPKENLAQIYSGNEMSNDPGFCSQNLRIGKRERRFGKFFFKLKNSSIGQSSYSVALNDDFEKINKIKSWKLFKHKIGKWLINTGLWEIIFKPRLSQEMNSFIKDFDPQIIYCQGYSLTFTWLPLMIHKKFGIPICFQTGDDWPTQLYKNSPISFVIKPIVRRTFNSLLKKSSARMANGKLMAKEYFERYHLSFESVMMSDDLGRFQNAMPLRVVNSDTISVIYTGGLANMRYVPIIDLCKAVKLLKNVGEKIIITVFATTIPLEAVNLLKEQHNLQILPNPPHEELPSYLKGADILYLPESFDKEMVNRTHLSISTKAHLYMMSEKPTIVYASAFTGIANYAKEEEWACVVQEQNLSKLADALKNLIENREYSENLINKGIEISLKNHDERRVRARFLSILNESFSTSKFNNQ